MLSKDCDRKGGDIPEPAGNAGGRPAADAERLPSEDILSSIFRSVTDAIITLDQEVRVIEMNQAAERLCGFTRAGALGVPFSTLPRECGGACAALLKHPLSGGPFLPPATWNASAKGGRCKPPWSQPPRFWTRPGTA
jgi:PAS domain-containing protein